jgi:hypothetical protein
MMLRDRLKALIVELVHDEDALQEIASWYDDGNEYDEPDDYDAAHALAKNLALIARAVDMAAAKAEQGRGWRGKWRITAEHMRMLEHFHAYARSTGRKPSLRVEYARGKDGAKKTAIFSPAIVHVAEQMAEKPNAIRSRAQRIATSKNPAIKRLWTQYSDPQFVRAEELFAHVLLLKD